VSSIIENVGSSADVCGVLWKLIPQRFGEYVPLPLGIKFVEIHANHRMVNTQVVWFITVLNRINVVLQDLVGTA
jgi:hypothetical protein